MSFKALKVWRALKRKPGSKPSQIAADLGWEFRSAWRCLCRLRESGSVIKLASGWFATDKAPVDGRGTALNTQATLAKYYDQAKANLAKANAVKAAKARARGAIPVRPTMNPRKPKPATELERCWPSLSIVGEIRQSDADVV